MEMLIADNMQMDRGPVGMPVKEFAVCQSCAQHSLDWISSLIDVAMTNRHIIVYCPR